MTHDNDIDNPLQFRKRKLGVGFGILHYDIIIFVEYFSLIMILTWYYLYSSQFCTCSCRIWFWSLFIRYAYIIIKVFSISNSTFGMKFAVWFWILIQFLAPWSYSIYKDSHNINMACSLADRDWKVNTQLLFPLIKFQLFSRNGGISLYLTT